jgi:hypothetical protein
MNRASEHLDRAADHTGDAAEHAREAGHHAKEAMEAGASAVLERTRDAAREVGHRVEDVAESAGEAARRAGRVAGHVAEHVSHAQPDRALEHRTEGATERALDSAGQALRQAAPTVGRATETVVGATGSLLHTVGGALGLIVGKIAGRVGGWWNAASEAIAELPEEERQACQVHFDAYELRPADLTFETAQTAYLLGYLAAENPAYQERPFEQIETDLQHGWTGEQSQEYTALRDFTRFGYERARIIRPSQDEERVSFR